MPPTLPTAAWLYRMVRLNSVAKRRTPMDCSLWAIALARLSHCMADEENIAVPPPALCRRLPSLPRTVPLAAVRRLRRCPAAESFYRREFGDLQFMS